LGGALRIWVPVTNITDEFVLGPDVLRAYDASVGEERHVLRMGREEVTLWNPGTRPRSSRLTLLSDEGSLPDVRVVTAQLDAIIEAANALAEPSLKSFRKGTYIARTLVRARERVLVRIVNVS
jgi:hypothetical protein